LNHTSLPFFLASALLALSLSLAGCGESSKPPATAVGTSVNATVMTVQSSLQPIISTAPGSVVAEQQAQIASRLTGFISAINVQEGQSVVAGQRLFTVDPAEVQGQLSQAQAGLAQAEAALADAKNDYARFGNLYKEEAIPKQQWDKVRLQYQVAQQQALAARAGMNSAGAQMRYATLTAPFAGVVTQKLANVGDLATPGKPVLVIENSAKLQVQTSVPAEIFSRLKLGDSVSLQLDGSEHGDAVNGKVARLVAAADPVSRSYLVKIDLPSGHPYKSGMYVKVGFASGERVGIRVPQAAVLDRVGITGVFVVDGDNIAQFRMVRTGASENGQVEIQAGLSAGERIVTTGNAALQSGDKVVSSGGGNV
jgi:RND family efflux transporter MFP subunit